MLRTYLVPTEDFRQLLEQAIKVVEENYTNQLELRRLHKLEHRLTALPLLRKHHEQVVADWAILPEEIRERTPKPTMTNHVVYTYKDMGKFNHWLINLLGTPDEKTRINKAGVANVWVLRLKYTYKNAFEYVYDHVFEDAIHEGKKKLDNLVGVAQIRMSEEKVKNIGLNPKNYECTGISED